MLSYESSVLEVFIWLWWQAEKKREDAESHWHKLYQGMKLKESGKSWEGLEARLNRH